MAQASEMPSKVLVPAADLVEDHQALGRGVVEDVGRLGHLDHERALAAAQVVGRADAGEQAVDDADPGTLGRDEAAQMGQDRDQGDLADVGALAGHVGAGDQEDRARRPRRAGRRWARSRPGDRIASSTGWRPASTSKTGSATISGRQ